MPVITRPPSTCRGVVLILVLLNSSCAIALSLVSSSRIATSGKSRMSLRASSPQQPPEDVPPYWYDPRIHVWGNIGWRGRMHAVLAPLATYVIDQTSYSGIDVRKRVHDMLDPTASVLDLACGVGFSTLPGAHGIDTSPAMLDVARWRRPDAHFTFGNAETFGEERSYDIVTCMFACHESRSARCSNSRAAASHNTPH